MRPAHHHPEALAGAKTLIITNGLIGGIQGAAVGLVSAVVANKYWTRYSNLTRQFKTFVMLGFIIGGGCWKVDTGLIEYERRLQFEHLQAQKQQMEDAVNRGEYVDITGRTKPATGKN
uniref:ARAD1A11440p n=1 Tax=Blastobotrys adeninivorans TaxID=409370 RepID=A0A060SX86_BLAAD